MKTNYQYGLVIGRFQPPCLHHFEFLKEVVSSGINELFLGIGEPLALDTRHFLTSKEIKSLLIPNLNKLHISYHIEVIPDIGDPPKYVNHVQKFFPIICETNTCLFTENSYTSDCFINYGYNFEVVVPTILDNRATNVRQMILNNDLNWKNLVPKNVFEYLIKNNRFPLAL